MKNAIRRAGTLSLSASLLLIPVLAWFFRLDIYDWARLHNYQPPAPIKQLAINTTMNDVGKHLFYVYHPAIESKDTFSKHCTESERTIVLGCYAGDLGIYVYDVKDVRLAGIEEVTAAHEMLHVAYERLKPQEKQKINNLILQAYSQVTDQRIRDNIESYRQAGVDTTNELHSILGTEVAQLLPDLEAYYKRYFSDRAKIVAYSEQYEGVFTDRKNRVAADDVALKNIKTQIDNFESSLKTQAQTLTSERQHMDRLLASNQIADYNAAVPVYNQKVGSYNSDVNTERNLIDQYNTFVKERNTLALEENELIKAIDSHPNTVNTQ